MNVRAREANFDGLVGPTHNYAGLALGNMASLRHGGQRSNPRSAALQGLAKMKRLMALGLIQGVLPPQERPDVAALRRLGFHGRDDQVLSRAGRDAPELLAACASASSMWAANAATVSPAADTADGRTHFTPANLVSHLHRSLESESTARALSRIFADPARFVHHPPLPATSQLGDEGAANHMRLCHDHGGPGIEVFVYGQRSTRFAPRQQRQAAEAVARRHRLDAASTVFIEQHPDAIDAGVFHNDVIAVANQSVLLCHTCAFAEGSAAIERTRRACVARCGGDLDVIGIGPGRLSLDEAVRTYLFNSQLVTVGDGARPAMALVCPVECAGHASVRRALDAIVADANPIREVVFVDTRQSMRNGGGPACLRLRVVLDDADLAAVHGGALLDDQRHADLCDWVTRHYRERLDPADLADPLLLEESRTALDRLTGILGLGSLYAFQREGGRSS